MKVNERAARIHRFMVDHPGFGYSWEERYGGPETVEVEGITLRVGDYDCSSSTITAWSKALTGTPYEGCLDGAVTTHNMRSVFVGSGLFEWVPVDQAQVGDLYLNEQNHVAMCQGDGLLSEFCWGDNGAYGNQRGDQSGVEAYCHGFYEYWDGWDGCLHYNGKADTGYDYDESEFDMTEAIFHCDDAHGGYPKDAMVYWNPTAGFCYLEDMDCVHLIKECSPGIKEINSSKKAPWIYRARQATNPTVAAKTYGMLN